MNKLSIICPSYNCSNTIRTLIESVVRQTCDNYELIIIDGGSTDGTVDILKEYGGKLTFISEKDNGIYDAMNKGISMATGEWLYFIGADDSLYSENVIEQIQPHLNTDAGIILCDIMSPTLGRCSSSFSLKTFFKNTVHHQGVIYSRRIFADRMYDATLRIMADYDMNMYIWRKGFGIATTDIVFANHAPEGISGQVRLINYQEETVVRNRYLHSKLLQWFFTLVGYSKFAIKSLRKKCL